MKKSKDIVRKHAMHKDSIRRNRTSYRQAHKMDFADYAILILLLLFQVMIIVWSLV